MRLVQIALCIAGMTGFWYLIKFLVNGISNDFAYGFGAGVFLFVFMFWLCERWGVLFVVEPSKGEWIPFDRQQRRPNSDF